MRRDGFADAGLAFAEMGSGGMWASRPTEIRETDHGDQSLSRLRRQLPLLKGALGAMCQRRLAVGGMRALRPQKWGAAGCGHPALRRCGDTAPLYCTTGLWVQRLIDLRRGSNNPPVSFADSPLYTRGPGTVRCCIPPYGDERIRAEPVVRNQTHSCRV